MTCCSNYDDVLITLESVQGKCEHHLKKGAKFSVKDLVPGGLCVHAYNVAFPYCNTLLKKGWFLWVKENDGVIAQCPNPDCSLVMKIKKREGGVVGIEVIEIRGDCPNKHKVCEVFELNPKKMKICPEIFPAVYAPATLLNYREGCREEAVFVRAKTQTSEFTLKIEKVMPKKSLRRP